ncbi:glycosyltransferase [Caldimonas aquatica]|uniref:Glycosyltransferase n=1 Tax=Caldimonas aquatica TaxID=376175 RepID=A0ABY6MUI3_9BURK|nr:glycosyltransferase [Schlegelella aquatica]UZD55667.1 glycosyltransferase [Schlegelella aquatica]
MTPPSSNPRPRVLIAHNSYQQRGGEDAVVEAEAELLRSRGHAVRLLVAHNDAIVGMPRSRLAARTLWSSQTVRDFRQALVEFRPDILHVHNTFPLISPSIYWAAARAGVPVVQTLHNFRLLCPQAMLLREGRICEDCVGRLPWRGVVRRCYRGSAAQSGVLAGMISLHRALGTWGSKVDRYIALNEFCRRKFIEGGLPAQRIVVKPNFVDFPAPEDGAREGVLFVGRLAEEKGLSTLCAAARLAPDVAVRVAGTGPQAGLLQGIPSVTSLGALSAAEVREAMCGAQALVMPSLWYENFPRTLVEAFACALPVIASRIGALAELVEDGVTGLLFEPGNAADLAAKMKWAAAHPDALMRMGQEARRRYLREFSPEVNYRRLTEIYAQVLAATPVVGLPDRKVA